MNYFTYRIFYSDLRFLDGLLIGSDNHTYLGCYIDDKSRVLEHREEDSKTLTLESCVEKCRKGNYTFVGLEFSRECFCGRIPNSYARIGRVNNDKCNFPCLGDRSQSCGGFFRISVYQIPPGTCYRHLFTFMRILIRVMTNLARLSVPAELDIFMSVYATNEAAK